MNMSTRFEDDTGVTDHQGALNATIASLIESVWRELDGQLSCAQVSCVVAAILAEYQDAPVQTFVPILVHGP